MDVENYKVLVEGSNFLMPLQSEIKTVGFFCTLWVPSECMSSLEEHIQSVMTEKIKESSLGVKRGIFSKSRIIVESVSPCEEDIPPKSDGFTFYEMTVKQKLLNMIWKKGIKLE